MKNLKEHKVQILAALALAFSLGMVIPSTTFAMGGEGEPVALADGATTSTQQLLDVISQATKADNYTLYKNLVNGYNNLAAATSENQAAAVTSAVNAVKALVTDAPLTNASPAASVLAYIGNMNSYKTWAPVINAINAAMKEANVTTESAITADGLKNCTPAQIESWYNEINNVVNPTPATYAENIVVLAGRVKTAGAFANYWTYEPVVAGAIALEAKPNDAGLKAELAKNVGNILNVSGAANLNVEALLAQAKGIENYDKYAALYNSMNFIREALPEGVTDISAITAEQLNTKYPMVDGKDPLVNYYTAFGTAANNIDASVMNNLIKLPNTSVPGGDDKPEEKPDDNKVNTPNTGIVGLIESGALDLGMVTLIASVAVASVAGLGLIAKLYLKKKF